MPNAVIGERIKNVDKGGGFINLKDKDSKATIRIVREDFYYNGKHFLQGTGGKWTVTECPRIMENNPCDKCQQYFDIMKEAKMPGISEDQKKAIKERAKPFGVGISFFYAVLDRADGLVKILQTTAGVRGKIDTKIADGEKVMNFDYVLKNTKKPGEWFTLDRVDSAETKEISAEEIKEIADAQKWDIAEMVDGNKSSESLAVEGEEVFIEGGATVTTEKLVEKKDVTDDIPF